MERSRRRALDEHYNRKVPVYIFFLSLSELFYHRLNSDVLVEDYNLAFTPSLFDPLNATSTPSALLNPTFSLILDCTDNPSTRHLINAYAVAHDIPLVSGGAVRSEGIVGVYNLPLPPSPELPTPERGPCYACVFPPTPKPEIPLSEEQIALQGTGACSDEGVLGILCGMVGVSMGAEALRVILSIGTGLSLFQLTATDRIPDTVPSHSQANTSYVLPPIFLSFPDNQTSESQGDLSNMLQRQGRLERAQKDGSVAWMGRSTLRISRCGGTFDSRFAGG